MGDGKPRVYWDSTVWVAWNNGENDARDICGAMLEDAERGDLEIVVGALVLAEFAPKDETIDSKLDAYLRRSSFKLVTLTRSIATQARALTRKYKGLPGSDAVHLACALYAKAGFLFTYDEKHLLKFASEVTDIKICKPCWLGQTRLILEAASAKEPDVAVPDPLSGFEQRRGIDDP